MSTRSLTRSGSLLPSVFDDFFGPWNEWVGNAGITGRQLTQPAVNITEDKDNYKVALAAPGMKKEDFKIDLEGNMLTISSEKEESSEEKESSYTRKEYSYSTFSRTFTLPDSINQDKIEAKYTDGVLNVVLPKKEEVKKQLLSKNIAVK